MSGVDADGKVPLNGSTEWKERMFSTNEAFVVTPEIGLHGEELYWTLIGLFSGGFEHSWHSKDVLHPMRTSEGTKRYYHRVESNIPFPGEAYLMSYNLRNNNCTTRFGYPTP